MNCNCEQLRAKALEKFFKDFKSGLWTIDNNLNIVCPSCQNKKHKIVIFNGKEDRKEFYTETFYIENDFLCFISNSDDKLYMFSVSHQIQIVENRKWSTTLIMIQH